VGEYSIPVLTGNHAETTREDTDVGSKMSELLLTPGSGADVGLMAQALDRYSRIADIWASRVRSVELLRRLLSLGEPLHSQACGVLVANYYGQEDCLMTVAEDATESNANREWAKREFKEKLAERQLVLEDLKDPAQLRYQDRAGDSRHRLREELETLLFNPDPTLHERSCRALARYFPWHPESKCP